jgi:hypothetical protein
MTARLENMRQNVVCRIVLLLQHSYKSFHFFIPSYIGSIHSFCFRIFLTASYRPFLFCSLILSLLGLLLTSSITLMKIESEMKSDCVLQWSPNLFLAVCLHVKVVHDVSTLTGTLLSDHSFNSAYFMGCTFVFKPWIPVYVCPVRPCFVTFYASLRVCG